MELVEINRQRGSLTEWIETASSIKDAAAIDEAKFKKDRESPEYQKTMDDIAALDYLTNNLDRVQNLGNYLMDYGPGNSFKRLLPSDHDLTYTSTRPRARIPEFASTLPTRYSTRLAEKLRLLDTNRAAFLESIRPLVGDEAIPGVNQRLDELLAGLNRYEQVRVGRAAP